ncbi:MAG: hypothetical protein JXA28_04800 [Bacteroidetes bacterium]|nr:hypothetical protein [Bacteroidota bacterium]
MTQKRKDRQYQPHLPVTNEGGNVPMTSGGVNQGMQDAREKLAAADEAIANALSGDSVEFLENFRQEGGE